MKELMEQFDGTAFPDLIRNMPEVDVPFDGVRCWLMGDGERQTVFFDNEAGAEVPPHSHCAQWGIVVTGEMTFTIGDKTRAYKAGEWYYIPEGVIHAAKVNSRMSVVDVFDAPDRYKTK